MKLLSTRFLLAGIFLTSSLSVIAQEVDPIATERPTQSIGSLIVPLNSFQLEQGFTYAQDTLVLDGFFRFGVSKIAELRIFTYYDSPLVTIGAKVNILQNKDYRPGIALKADINGGVITDYRIAIMQKLSDSFSSTVNLGKANDFYGVLAIGYSFADRFAAYVEGYFEGNYKQFNSGITFALNGETQFDLNTGWYDYQDMYVTIGFARRLVFKSPE